LTGLLIRAAALRKGLTRSAGLALAGAATLAWAAEAPRAMPEAARAPALAITFDDLPAHGPLPPGDGRLEVAQRIIAALDAAGAPPTWGFVNGVRGEEPAGSVEPSSWATVLPAWRAAGFPLGNHGWSHMNLAEHSAAEFEADIVRNEPLLGRLMPARDWRWFRFPFLQEGDTPAKRAEVRRFLGARGYRIAAVTMSFADYSFNPPYARCAERGDGAGMARLEQAYLAAAAAEAARARRMSRAVYGRDIPYVLLMHLGALDARMAPRLLAQYREEGFRFVSLRAAEQDPAYAVDLQPGRRDGPDTLEAAMKAKALTPPPSPDLSWLDGICR
jgi:peptidoglycan-N-acetylglucosamine deacetylase